MKTLLVAFLRMLGLHSLADKIEADPSPNRDGGGGEER